MMKNYRSREMQTAYENGGYRERYGLDHGNKATVYIRGRKYFKFTYSRQDEYQDANGALYDIEAECWVS